MKGKIKEIIWKPAFGDVRTYDNCVLFIKQMELMFGDGTIEIVREQE
jgi:hypothetical protein